MTSVLKGIRVLETANLISGPYTAHLLGELGAEVVKVENPKGGDPFRSFTSDGYSAQFCAYNTNKRSVTLDIAQPAGREVLLKLLPTCDVLVQNFRPGVMERLGLGWDELSAVNSRLIYCSVSGFGQSGPYKHRPAYDTVAGGIAGLLSQFVPTEAPRIAGPALADCITGLYACYGILGALFERTHTDRGRRVDVAMMETVIAFMREPFAGFFRTGKTPGPLDRPAASQSFAFKCADGKLVGLHLSSAEKFWLGLAAAIHRPDLARDPRFDTRAMRMANFATLTDELAESFKLKPRAEWMALLDTNDVPFAPINDFQEVIDDRQTIHLGTFVDLVHPTMGKVKTIARPVFYDNRREIDASAPPLLGEHTDATLQAVGVSNSELEKLRTAGVI
jgi:crotonobetainyl-CoA:carnitine CoA-transferase CaiB-like acyl-CoA transferase